MQRRRKWLVAALIGALLLLAAVPALALNIAEEGYQSNMYGTFWALVPPIVAIALALITKEVFSSLFIGIVTGALFYSNFNVEGALMGIFSGWEFESGGFQGAMIEKLADGWNVGILIFLVMLGMLVVLMNQAGGSAAYGRWASKRISSRRGALLSTFGLGVLIFVDDYFNCLTVGSVMRPVTDKFNISRAKLAYLIDSTAAPICIIAPISSWAAAVTGVVKDVDGFALFLRAIPYNFYALLTVVMILTLAFLKFDYGPMRLHEENAKKGDLFTSGKGQYDEKTETNEKGRVIDLVLPVIVLILCCIGGMLYTGGFFEGASIKDAFAGCDASVGLALGSVIALLIVFLLFVPRKVLSFKEFTAGLPAGFRAMVPAILILIMAWTLSGVTGRLGAAEYVASILDGSAKSLANFLPAIVFLIACGLAFATGTSWGTFGILLPIVVKVLDPTSELMIITISACLAGAVCGDHCSPISDTTIMASTGAQCDHINHVSTQLPYALTVAAVSFIAYILAGFIQTWFIMLPVAIVMMVGTLAVIYFVNQRSGKASKRLSA